MEALLQIVGGIGGLVLLYYGAEFLVRGGVQIAKRFQVTPLVIGLTLVAFATSAPELVVSCDAALKGMGDIALGNVIGSNICNIALILGLCAVIAPLQVNASLFKLDLPLMIGSSVLFALFCFLTGGINRIEGALFFAGIIAYVVVSIRNARRSGDVVTEVEGDGKPLSLGVSIVLVLLGLGFLVGGARLLVNSAVWLAELFGVSQAVIGLTIVAIGTSLPELATSVIAALKGERDIAIGNVVGSNIFNILAIMGISPLLRPCGARTVLSCRSSVLLPHPEGPQSTRNSPGRTDSDRSEIAFFSCSGYAKLRWLIVKTSTACPPFGRESPVLAPARDRCT